MTNPWKKYGFWAVLALTWAALAWAFYAFIYTPAFIAPEANGILKTVWDGRDVEILSPMMLALGLALPVLFVIRRYTLSDLPDVQQLIATLIRALVLLALALGLSRVVFTTFDSKVTTVFMVDVSASMPDEAIEAAQKRVQALYDARGDNEVKLIRFATEADQIDITPGASKLPPILRFESEDAALNSDAQSAMRLAYGLFPQHHVKRLVVFSDGNQTRGDILGEAYNARDYGIKVYAHEFDFKPRPEILVRGFLFPEELNVGEPFELGVEVYSTLEGEATLTLEQNEFKAGNQTVTLKPGENLINFKTEVFQAGATKFKVALKAADKSKDTFKPNNRFDETVDIKGKPRVLYIEGEQRATRYFVQAMQKENIEVETRQATGMPTQVGEYRKFDAVVFSDVPAHLVRDSQLRALDQYVRNIGGGLIVTGGEDSFGPGGYAGSYLEQMLPVSFDGEKNKETPSVALMLVLDRSGSMKGQRIAMTKEAAKAAVDMLQKQDSVGVIAFADSPQEVVPLRRATNKVRIRGQISRLQANGGTQPEGALEMAFVQLTETAARRKHIIFMADGQFPLGGIVSDLVPAMRDERITISTVSVGNEAERRVMNQIAREGGGRSYRSASPQAIPKIFMKETSEVARSQFVEEPFRPRVARRSQAIRGISFQDAPPLLGYVSTKAKPGAEVILVSEYGEPILARSRRGLGKTIVFTSDIKNRWGRQWLKWPGYQKLWAQLVRDSMRVNSKETLPMELSLHRGKGRIVVDAIAKDDSFMNDLTSTVGVKPPGESETLQVELHQTAPGRYEGEFPLTTYGSYMVEAKHTNEDGDSIATSTGTLAWPYPDEYLTLEPNWPLIRKTAKVGGGEINAEPAKIFDPEGEKTKEKFELWPYFLFAALGLFVLDVLLRRLRLYGQTAIPWERVAGRG